MCGNLCTTVDNWFSDQQCDACLCRQKRSKRRCKHTQIEDRLPRSVRLCVICISQFYSSSELGAHRMQLPVTADAGCIDSITGGAKAKAACLSDVNFETKFILAAQRQGGKLILIFCIELYGGFRVKTVRSRLMRRFCQKVYSITHRREVSRLRKLCRQPALVIVDNF